MKITVLIMTATILSGCTTMYPPSPLTHDQNPGPMAESTVTYERADEPTPIYDDKYRYDDVRIRTTRFSEGDESGGGCMQEHYSQDFDMVRMTTWTFKNERTDPHAEIGDVPGEEVDLWEPTQVRLKKVSSSRELNAWFGTAYHPGANVVQTCMKIWTWYPAATGGNFVVQDPARRQGIVLMATSYLASMAGDQGVRLVSWAHAVRIGWVQCERRVGSKWTRITDWRECAKYKPDQLLFFHVLGNWI